jgi:hypothetical protein
MQQLTFNESKHNVICKMFFELAKKQRNNSTAYYCYISCWHRDLKGGWLGEGEGWVEGG